MDRNNTISDVVEMQQEVEAFWYLKNQFGLILTSSVHVRREMGMIYQ